MNNLQWFWYSWIRKNESLEAALTYELFIAVGNEPAPESAEDNERALYLVDYFGGSDG